VWFVAPSVIRDLAALNKVETLPWDIWGAMPRSDAMLDDDALAYFDQLAAIAADPDANFAKLRQLYREDARVRIPPTVFNALRQQPEAL
jgi:hypothetical protein